MNSQASNGAERVPGPDEWVDLYGHTMYRYAMARLSDPEMAKDLVQETLVAAVHAFKQFEGKSSIKTWLIAILKRKIVDHFRRKKNHPSIGSLAESANEANLSFDETGHWLVDPGDWTVNPAKAYEQREFIDILYQCIAKLPGHLAEIVMLREFEEMSTEQICRKLDISESNSWVMLHRARLQLRRCLETNWLKNPK